MFLEPTEIDNCLFIGSLLMAGRDGGLSFDGLVRALCAGLQHLHACGVGMDLLNEGVEIRRIPSRGAQRHSTVLGCSGVRP